MTASKWLHLVALAVALPYGQGLTDKHARVLRCLARWQHRQPSHAQLARAARCSIGTVRNALRRGRRFELLSWKHRSARSSGRIVRIANRYTFNSPAYLPAPRPIGRKAKKGLIFSPPPTLDAGSHARQLAALICAAAAMPDMLPIRRALWERR